ncbi:MAG: tetratricopeptide repeat protein [Candidatus Lokiarchaeota archaeon]
MKAFKDIELNQEEIEDLIEEKENKLKELEKGSEYVKQLSDIALLQIEINQFEKAEKNLHTCLKHFQNLKDRLGEASVFGLLGTLHLKKEEYDLAIEFYQKSQKIYEELSQKQEIIICLKGIGSALMKKGDFRNSTEIFLKCSEICSNQNDIYGLLDCLGNLIQIHEREEKWDIVLELYQKTLKAFGEIRDKKGIIISYFNIGIIYKNNSKYGKALEFFKKGTNVAIEANFAEYIIKGLSYVGESLFYLGKIKEAKSQYIKALYLAEKNQVLRAFKKV